MKKLSIVILTLTIILSVSPVAAATVDSSSSIVRIAGNIVVESGQVVHGDVVAIFGNVEVHGEVYGDVITVLGNTAISSSGKVWGDAVSAIGNLDTASGSSVAGNKVNIIGNSNGSFLLSNINFRSFVGFKPVWDSMKLITGILLAILIVALFPVPVERVKKSIQSSPGRMALIGIMVWVVAVPLIALVALTIIGIPLAFLLGVTMWVAGRLGYAALVLIIGSALLKNTKSAPLLAGVGALLLGLVTIVPIVGGLVGLAVSVVTIGAAIITRLGTRDEVTTSPVV